MDAFEKSHRRNQSPLLKTGCGLYIDGKRPGAGTALCVSMHTTRGPCFFGGVPRHYHKKIIIIILEKISSDRLYQFLIVDAHLPTRFAVTVVLKENQDLQF